MTVLETLILPINLLILTNITKYTYLALTFYIIQFSTKAIIVLIQKKVQQKSAYIFICVVIVALLIAILARYTPYENEIIFLTSILLLLMTMALPKIDSLSKNDYEDQPVS